MAAISSLKASPSPIAFKLAIQLSWSEKSASIYSWGVGGNTTGYE